MCRAYLRKQRGAKHAARSQLRETSLLCVYLRVNNNDHKISALPKTAAVNYYDKVNKVKSNSATTCHASCRVASMRRDSELSRIMRVNEIIFA